MTVAELNDKMSGAELKSWVRYMSQYPLGWKDDLRTFYVMRSMGAKVEASEVFNSLSVMEKHQKSSEKARLAKLKKNPFLGMLRHKASEAGHEMGFEGD